MGFNDLYRFSVHAVIPDADGRILLIKQSYGDGRWGLPGGSVEPGETVQEAIRRECREELGVEVEIGPFTGLYYHREFNAQVGIFRCHLTNDTDIRLSEEHSEYAWVSPSELGTAQQLRVHDALEHDGRLAGRVF